MRKRKKTRRSFRLTRITTDNKTINIKMRKMKRTEKKQVTKFMKCPVATSTTKTNSRSRSTPKIKRMMSRKMKRMRSKRRTMQMMTKTRRLER